MTLQFNPAEPQVFFDKDLQYNGVTKFHGVFQGCRFICRDTHTNRTWSMSRHCNNWKFKVTELSYGTVYGFTVLPFTLEGSGAVGDEALVRLPEIGKSDESPFPLLLLLLGTFSCSQFLL